MNVRAHLLVPPHFLFSTAFKKMRWKDEFGKWFPKLPNFSRIMWNVSRLVRPALQKTIMIFKIDIAVVVVYLTLTDPLRIQPWSQDRR